MPKVSFDSKKGLVQSAGSSIIDLGGVPLAGNRRKVITVAGDTALGLEDSGAIVSVTDGPATITLPAAVAAAKGMWFDVVLPAALAGGKDITIDAVTDATVISLAVTSAAANGTAITSGDQVTIASAQDALGDRIHLFCDGTLWYARGLANSATAIVSVDN